MNSVASTEVEMMNPSHAMAVPRLTFKSPMIPALALAVMFSLVLFMLMYSAIHVGKFVHEKSETLQTIDFVRLKRDTEVETLSRRKPPPPSRRRRCLAACRRIARTCLAPRGWKRRSSISGSTGPTRRTR